MTEACTGDDAMLAGFETLALAAGELIMRARREGFAIENKIDETPVTWADREAERIILTGLAAGFPDVPVVAEEAVTAGILPERLGASFFLVDPLDGTREFISGSGDFTVNIALVRAGVPQVGVVYAPARGELYLGRPGRARACTVGPDHAVTGRHEITVAAPGPVPIVVASHSHRTVETDTYIATLGTAEILSVGSSIKFCMLAAGKADLYPRFGPTMQWDTAAGDAVLRAAGGRTLTLDGTPLTYGCEGRLEPAALANPWFIADGGASA